MKYVKVIIFLLAWYFASIGLFFFAFKVLGNIAYDGEWKLVALFLATAGAIGYLSFTKNFLSNCISRFGTFAALFLLLCGGLVSCAILWVGLYGM